jgi:hypothetical protein
VVIFTADDWCGKKAYQQAFINACEAARKNGVVVSPGILPRGLFKLNYPGLENNQWKDIQAQINKGLVCPVSHSMSHRGKKYSYNEHGTSYEIEIGGSKKSIIDNLTLPLQNQFNSSEYMVAWIEPYGKSDAKILSTLAKNNYLVSRSTVLNQYRWAKWNNIYGLYHSDLTIDIASRNSLALLDSKFDNAYSRGLVYHVNIHPGKYDWVNDDKAVKHLGYIGNRKDVWYAGFGHAYMYHYLEDKVKPLIQTIKNAEQEIIVKINVPETERKKYGLSYPITYKVSIPSNWQSVHVYSQDGSDNDYMPMTEKTSSDFFNGIDAYRKNLVQNEVFISKGFPQTSNYFHLKLEKAGF